MTTIGFWSMELADRCIEFVDSAVSQALENLLFALEHVSIIGMDAEWKPVRSIGKRPKLSILQISCRIPDEEDRVFIVDMLTPGAADVLLEPIRRVLQNPKIVKLGFKLKGDLAILASSLGESPDLLGKVQTYIDVGKLYRQTRVVGSSSGRRDESLGLSSICEAVLGLPLCKDMQCSDWEERPLTPSQLAYAAADAYCLIAIWDALQGDLEKLWKVLKDKAVGMSELLYLQDSSSSSSSFCSNSAILTRFRIETSNNDEGPVDRVKAFLGETFLVKKKEGAKRGGRKPRNRVKHDGKEDVKKWHWYGHDDWHGPAPWDPSLGGDGEPKFLCDVMVEGLARHLRCVGVDAATPAQNMENPRGSKPDPRQVVEQAYNEGRVLLTRDMKLLKQRLIPANHAYRVKNLKKMDQLLEIIETFKLNIREEQLLSRCTKCNGDLCPQPLTAEEAKATSDQEIPPQVMCQENLVIWQCSKCKHLYWQGFQFRNAMEQFTLLCSHGMEAPSDSKETGLSTKSPP